MAALDHRHHLVPWTLNVGAVGMHMVREVRLFDYPLTGGDLRRDRHAYAQRNHTEIDNDVHCFLLIQTTFNQAVPEPAHNQTTAGASRVAHQAKASGSRQAGDLQTV